MNLEATSDVVIRAPSAIGEVTLRRYTSAAGSQTIELRVNGIFVMDTAQSTSEVRLANVALAHHDTPRRVLVGGLGLGYTTLAVLADPRVAHVDVVEIASPLIDWATTGLLPNGAVLTQDPRCQLHQSDVSQWISDDRHGPYDVIVLDVDNGPKYLVHQPNQHLYEHEFFATYHRTLSPGGVLAIWAAQPAEGLAKELQSRFDYVITEQVEVTLAGRPDHYFIYLARR